MFIHNRFKKIFGIILAISTLACTALLGSFAPSLAQLSDKGFQPERFLSLKISLGPALAMGEIEGVRLSDPVAMQVFYAAREERPFWMGRFGTQSRAGQLVEVLERAWQHGLNPETYHVKKIKALMNVGLTDPAPLEMLLSDAFIRYAHDMTGMRIAPAALKLGRENWRRNMGAAEALALMNSGRDMGQILQSLEPQSATYKMLQNELIRLVQEPENSSKSILPLNFGNRIIRPMTRHERIPDLRMRLGAPQQTPDALLYDDSLSAAVIKFQRAHGLKDDGLIGPGTVRFLNQSKHDRILQIIANLERLRWIDPVRPDKYVVVNIPSATLWAIEGGQVAFEMPVIVGKKARPTNSFVTEIKGVRLNPDWTVPPTIKRQDIWPKLQEDPRYLSDKGIELYKSTENGSQTLDPSSVDWEDMKPSDLHSLRMVQMAGEHNPLGRVRVLMPNDFNIYLHDTNQKSLFAGFERAQSSGCVRMQEPEKMAAFIMKSEGWDDAQLQSALATGKTRDYMISQPIPVYVLYYTTWVDENGRIVFGSDLYGQDDKLIDLLEKVDGFSIPRHNTAETASSGRIELSSSQ